MHLIKKRLLFFIGGYTERKPMNTPEILNIQSAALLVKFSLHSNGFFRVQGEETSRAQFGIS